MERWDDGNEMLMHSFIENYEDEIEEAERVRLRCDSPPLDKNMTLREAKRLIEEALNRRLPDGIEKFLKNILPAVNYPHTHSECAINAASIDDNVIKRCKEWLDLQEDAERLFCKIEMNKISKIEDLHDDFDKNLSEFTPFSESWKTRDIENIFKIEAQHSDFQSYCEEKQRHRGRAAPIESSVTEERPFMCTYKDCKRAFKRLEHLKRHFKMHTGERPYRCTYPGCRRAFSRSDNLNSHFKVHGVVEKGLRKTQRRRFDG